MSLPTQLDANATDKVPTRDERNQLGARGP